MTPTLPKNISASSFIFTCQNVRLYGKNDFTDAIKDLEMGRLSWIILI